MWRLSQLPLRWRLTAWYLLSLSLILLLSGSILYWQTQRSLLAQVDTALQVAAAQAAINVDRDNGRLAFQNAENRTSDAGRLNRDTAIFLLDPAGVVWDKLGQGADVASFPLAAGFQTYRKGKDMWRVYSEPAADPGHTMTGWIQVAQSVEPTAETLAMLRLQLLWTLPLALVLAGLGGYWLAARALAPIDRMTNTARAIGARDLSQRIGYTGPADEIGRLAATFDHMLDRLQVAFDHERRFTGDAAHELRTPLSALKGRLEVTLGQPRQPAEYVETLQEMGQQVERLIRLSSDLLYMARLDQGQRELHDESIVLADLLSAVVDQVRPLAESKGITLVEAVPAGLEVRGDLDMLIRLFLNLLDNAVKYTPAGGQVVLRAEMQPAGVTVTVSDNGPGIADEHLPHLFERFYRAGSARTRSEGADGRGGAGLGLAIAFEIVKAHGGTLTVQSAAGQGTTFTVCLPPRNADRGGAA